MGDIIKSARYSYDELKIFRKIINEINTNNAFTSPLTITLGDEFQGIVNSLNEAVDVLFKIEEQLILAHYPFQLRYSIGYGSIITPINSEVAHGMYGEGLTITRELLEKSKRDKRRRIDVYLPNTKFSDILNELFFVYHSFPDNWNKKSFEVAAWFHEHGAYYQDVAEKEKKTVAQIWKREKNLRLREYFATQDTIRKVSQIFSILYEDANTSIFYQNMKKTIIESFKKEGIHSTKLDTIAENITPEFFHQLSKVLPKNEKNGNH